MSKIKSDFSPDLPVPDTVWNIFVFFGLSGILGSLVQLGFSAIEPDGKMLVYLFNLLCAIALLAYAWRKRRESLAQRYEGLTSMTAEELNTLRETQTEYFRYQLRNSYLIGFWGTVIPILLSLFFFYTSTNYRFLSVSFLSTLIFCWPLIISRVAMSLYYLRKLERTQQPV